MEACEALLSGGGILITKEEAAKLDANGNSLLHFAVALGSSDLIDKIIAANPTAVDTRSAIGRTPLFNCQNARDMTRLLAASPTTVEVTDLYGRLPLHSVCGNEKLPHKEAEKMVSVLVAAYPDGCRQVAINTNSLPLHTAITTARTPTTIKYLLDAYEGAAAVSNVVPSSSPGRRANSSSPLDVVGRISSSQVQGDGRNLNLPLHQSLSVGAPCWETVRMLVHAFPEAAAIPALDGRVPLLTALQKDAPPWLILCLLDAHPTGVLARFENNSPLMLAINNASCLGADGEEEREVIVKLLLKHFPLGILDQTGPDGMFPIDIAMKHCRWNLVGSILLTYIDLVSSWSSPDVVPPLTRSDLLLVDFLRLQAPPELIFMLTKAFPRMVFEEKGSALQLPLHVAVTLQCDIQIVGLLLELNPAAAAKEDYFGKLALHYAMERASPGVVGALVRALPVSASQPDRGTGKLPISIAFARKAPSYIFEELLLNAPIVASTPLPPSKRLPFFEAMADESNVDGETAYAILCASMPLLRDSMAPNPHYRGQLHRLVSGRILGENGDEEEGGRQLQLCSNLLARVLEEFTLIHVIAHSQHPKTHQTLMEACHPLIKPLLLGRMFLFGRYKRLKSTTGAQNFSWRVHRRPGSFFAACLCLDVKELAAPPETVGILCFEEEARFVTFLAALLEPKRLLLRTHHIVDSGGVERQLLETLLQGCEDQGANFVSFVAVVATTCVTDLKELLEDLHHKLDAQPPLNVVDTAVTHEAARITEEAPK